MPPVSTAPHSQSEMDLITYLEGMRQEGQSAKDLTDLRDMDDHLGLTRGQQWPRETPRRTAQFILNLLNDHVQRKTGLLTDARPVLAVKSTNPSYEGRTDMLTKVMESLWTETTWQESLAKGIGLTMIAGANVGMMSWDPLADYGRGDIRPSFFDPRSVTIDPSVTRATHLEHAEYMTTEEVRAVAALIEQFGERAEYVQPDAPLAGQQHTNRRSTAGMRGVVSAATGLLRRRFQQPATSAIPRAICRHYWFKDWKRDDNGRPMRYLRVDRADGTSVSRPIRREIRHVVVAGRTVLVDEPNPYWHKQYPIEVLDWGIETDHLWGQSEIRQLRAAQEALNRLASQILRNTNLMNNFIVKGDHNALDADGWNELTNRPAILLRKRPNTTLEFEAPPALPAYLFNLMEFLVKSIEMVGGLSEVTKGVGHASQSGISIESLQTASQTVIRFQARRIEAFLTRLFTKAIPLVFQFYTENRMRQIIGPNGDLITFLFDRAALTMGMRNIQVAFRDFVLGVHPMSSLNATRVQKAVLAGNLYGMGLIPGVAVLESAEWVNPEETLAAAKAEQAEAAMVQAMAAGLAPPGGAGGAPGGGGNLNRAAGRGAARAVGSFPAAPMGGG